MMEAQVTKLKWVPGTDLKDIDPEAPNYFYSEEEYFDWLISKFADTVAEIAKLTELKYLIRDQLDVEAGSVDKMTGTVKVVGDKYLAKLVRSVRTQYEKLDTDTQPFLQTVFEELECLRAAITIKFEEKPATMTKLLQEALDAPEDEATTVEEQELLNEVAQRRKLVKSAVSVKTEVK